MVDGEILFASGKWLKIAKIRGEEMREKEIEDPEHYLEALINNKGRILRADVF